MLQANLTFALSFPFHELHVRRVQIYEKLILQVQSSKVGRTASKFFFQVQTLQTNNLFFLQNNFIVTSRKRRSLHATQKLKRHFEARIFFPTLDSISSSSRQNLVKDQRRCAIYWHTFHVTNRNQGSFSKQERELWERGWNKNWFPTSSCFCVCVCNCSTIAAPKKALFDAISLLGDLVIAYRTNLVVIVPKAFRTFHDQCPLHIRVLTMFTGTFRVKGGGLSVCWLSFSVSLSLFWVSSSSPPFSEATSSPS